MIITELLSEVYKNNWKYSSCVIGFGYKVNIAIIL